MAFPNTLFPCIPLKTEVSDEEYKLFHSIDINLIKTLNCKLGRNLIEAINVVAFLMCLERCRLSVNAVYKVSSDWPGYKIDMLAYQVVFLLGWLENPTLDWGMRGDISLIQELCGGNVGFGDFHPRRLEILDEKVKIVNEMCARAFKNAFLGGSEVGFVGEPVCDSRELNRNGVGYDPRKFMNKNKNVVGCAAGPVHDSSSLQNYNHHGAATKFGVSFIPNPRELTILNHNGTGFGSVSNHVNGHRVQENVNGLRFEGGFNNYKFANKGPILPDVVVGPRMERNMRKSQSYEVGSTSGDCGAGSMTKQKAKKPIPEHELAVLLRGLNVTEEETEVPFVDRTVFLTFSRGYPVGESEIRNFFTRRFGNFIQAINFQQVAEGVQPLFARMIVRNTSIIPLICDVHFRTQYVISGKHVWAKKYVRKDLYITTS